MSTTINFRIDEEQKEYLQILADEKGIKISALTREIIIDYLNSLEDQDDNWAGPSKSFGEFIIPVPPIDFNNL